MFSIQEDCIHKAVTKFTQGVNAQLWCSNVLMAANAILVLIMVAISASGRHYRQVGVTLFLFQGATALYLPIVSYVASSIGKYNTEGLNVECSGKYHVAMLLTWTVLVQIVGTNTSAAIAADDADGKKLGPSIELLVRTIWTSYLVFYSRNRIILSSTSVHAERSTDAYFWNFLIVLCVLSLAKIALRFYAFEKARRSFALGRNSSLIAGYMEQLLGDSHRAAEDELIPPLIVMGEEKQKIEETPHGYTIKQRKDSLVTIDRVWQMATDNDILLTRQPWLKDLCLSFALCKLLKHQFAKCHHVVLGSTKVFNFVLDVLLNKGNPDTVFRVIADEVSFVLDSYYSSLPTSNFGRLLPVLNITVSLSIITWCLIAVSKTAMIFKHPLSEQMSCFTYCKLPDDLMKYHGFFEAEHRLYFGNLLFSSLPTYSLFVAVVLAEMWEIISYLCSNWFKVTLLCSYVTHVSWQKSPHMQRLLGLVLKLKVKFIQNWLYQMGQISVLAHPQPKKCALSRLFFYFSGQSPRVQKVNVTSEVKACIINVLKNSNGCLSKGTAALRNNGIGNHVLWACEEQDTSHVILVWHIATGIFEARHGASTGCSPDKKTTMDLSRYCAYLMASTPDLLPPDEAWSRKLYKTVRKDIKRALASGSVSVEYGSMVQLLVEETRHEVVKRGARLGKQLVELVSDEETGWRVLASFWSELILYVAPSHNIKAHKKARAHGTELEDQPGSLLLVCMIFFMFLVLFASVMCCLLITTVWKISPDN